MVVAPQQRPFAEPPTAVGYAGTWAYRWLGRRMSNLMENAYQPPASQPEAEPRASMERTLGKPAFPLGKVLVVLVIVHFMIALAIPLVFVLNIGGISPNLLGVGVTVWNIWRCHPLFIVLCLFLGKRSPPGYRRLLFVDVAISVFQVASVYFLYLCFEGHLLL